jgi:heme-degrading monooxygenase HmoA
MFIAMNRFKIVPGRENDFEKIWKERDSHLEGVPGFKEFHLVRGKKRKSIPFTHLTVHGVQRKIS